MLYHVVAVSTGNVIGKNNRLPWHFSSDLKHFKQLTMGQTVIMGRKTFESIGTKPLPGRENFVLSHSASLNQNQEHLKFFRSIEDALKAVQTEKAFIIGGESLFRQTIDRVDGIYLTQIEGEYEGDAFYPEIPPSFKEKSKEKLQEDPQIEVIFYENVRKVQM